MLKPIKVLLAASLFAVGVAGVSMPAQAVGGYCEFLGVFGGMPYYRVVTEGGVEMLSNECPDGWPIY